MQECGRKHYTSHATCTTSSKKLAICTCRCEQWLHDKEALSEYWSISYKKKQAYNHGQKSWDTLAFLRRFPIHTCPTPHLTPQEMLDMCCQNSFRVSNLYWVGEGELQDNFEKDALFYKGTHKLQKLLILLYFPNARTLVHDCRTF